MRIRALLPGIVMAAGSLLAQDPAPAAPSTANPQPKGWGIGEEA